MVANKAGRLEKRLGYHSLSGVDKGAGTSYGFSKGIALSSWNDADVLCTIGSGTWSTTGATVTALETYSDDLGGAVIRGHMPELKVVGDAVVGGTGGADGVFSTLVGGYASSPTVAVYGDYLVEAWIAISYTSSFVTSPTYPLPGVVMWQVTEISTGATVVAPQVLKPGVGGGAGGVASGVTFLRLAVVGSTFVVAFNNGAHDIYAATMASGTWSWGNGTILLTSNNAQQGAFDMRGVSGDSNHVVLAYYESSNNFINVYQFNIGLGLTANWSVTSTANAPTAFGLRADAGTFNELAVCWANGSPYSVFAGIATYSTLTSIAVLGAIYTGATTNETPPAWLDVTSNGSSGQLGGIPSYTVSWSPMGACWNPATYTIQGTGSTAGLLNAGNPITDTHFAMPDNTTFSTPDYRLFGTRYAENNARIIQCQFNYNGGWANTSGASAIITPGVTLASRGLEANGIVYYLGWIPSLTQGSFIALALDISADPLQNSTIVGTQYPMRPVANLMTRQANANPGFGNETVSLISGNLQNVQQAAPNWWGGGSEWLLSADNYGTSYVGYVSSSQGARLLPALGQLQTKPTTGFSSATFGTVTAFSGGIPTLFDGANVFEQGFLWAPDGVVAAVTGATDNTQASGSAPGLFGDTTNKLTIITNMSGVLPTMQGQTISIQGAGSSGNNGAFTITQVVNPTTVIISNPNATATDSNSYQPTLTWVIGPTNTNGSGPRWTSLTDTYSWVFTWEHFDAQGNFHTSARSQPVTISGYDLYYAGLGAVSISSIAQGSGTLVEITTSVATSLQSGDVVTITGVTGTIHNGATGVNGVWTITVIDNTHFTLNDSEYVASFSGGQVQSQNLLFPFTGNVEFYVPTLGATMRMRPVGNSNAFASLAAAPATQVSLGCYRTSVNGKEYLRLVDTGFDGIGGVYNSFAGTNVTFTDNILDSALTDGTHPLLYGDGTLGAPGSLDNFCPPATNMMVRHKERLFCAGIDDNLVMFTKQQGKQQGPGYNEQVDAFYVGGDDPVVGMDSLDTNLVVLKGTQVYYVGGDGPNDDGSSEFSKPQPIPTDAGCVSTNSVKATPEGVYYQSSAGLRLVTRGLAVEYVGGPVEDELTTYPIVLGAVLYPQNNRLLLIANAGDTGSRFAGELLVRDYVLDAWTTAVMDLGELQYGFVSAAVALAQSGGVSQKTLHLLTPDGRVWREHFTTDTTPYYDNTNYVTSTWTCPVVHPPGDQGRFRLWEIQILGTSKDPHGLVVSAGKDYGNLTTQATYTWSDISGSTPLSQIRPYYGQMGEAFQVSIKDVVDGASVTGQGFQVLGYTLGIGTYPGSYKLPAGQTK